MMHYKLPIFGYRIGNLAYITDAKTIPPSTMARLQGIDTLIINALRFKPHLSHMNLEETLAVVAQAKPRRALLIHERRHRAARSHVAAASARSGTRIRQGNYQSAVTA